MNKLRLNMVFKILILFVIISSIFVYLYINSSIKKFDTAINYRPPEIQKGIINKLKEKNIPFEIDQKGFILLQSKHEESVKEIEKQVKQFYYPDLPNFYISDPKQRDYFTSLLEKEKIPYTIKRLDSEGNEYIIWEWKFDKEVQKLILHLYDKMGVTQKPAKISFPTEYEKNIFINLLRKQNITFRVLKNKAGERVYIEYSWKDRNEVRKIVEKVYELMRAEGTYPPSE